MSARVQAGSPGAMLDGGRRERPGPRARAAGWFSWLFGLALLAALIFVALHYSEEREFVRIAERAEPAWLLVGLVLQAATYLAQGQTWRVVARAARRPIPMSLAFRLSLAKLFIDQALPSAGISGTVVFARALLQRGVPRPVVLASVVVNGISYFGAYVLTLLLALLVTIGAGHASPLILAVALLFLLASGVLITAFLVLAGRREVGPRWLARVPLLRTAFALLGEADPQLVRSVPLSLRCGLLQVAIVLLDAATVWVLIFALGERASSTGVYASFVLSNLLRTASVVPGGLGIFDAASVVTLKLAGVELPVALAATLLFRGLSFWLPMVPGLLFSRAARRGS